MKDHAQTPLSYVDIDSPCSEFDNGTPLHVAAHNLAVESATVLLYHGAHPHVLDSLGKMPIGMVFNCCFPFLHKMMVNYSPLGFV